MTNQEDNLKERFEEKFPLTTLAECNGDEQLVRAFNFEKEKILAWLTSEILQARKEVIEEIRKNKWKPDNGIDWKDSGARNEYLDLAIKIIKQKYGIQ